MSLKAAITSQPQQEVLERTLELEHAEIERAMKVIRKFKQTVENMQPDERLEARRRA